MSAYREGAEREQPESQRAPRWRRLKSFSAWAGDNPGWIICGVGTPIVLPLIVLLWIMIAREIREPGSTDAKPCRCVCEVSHGQ